jgi:hypothetical protein
MMTMKKMMMTVAAGPSCLNAAVYFSGSTGGGQEAFA